MVRERIEEERLNAYRHAFHELFREWRIALPEQATTSDAAGEVTTEQGTIQYRLREYWGDEYLELYTSERGRNDRLYRIHCDGRVELIAAGLDGRARRTARGRDEAHRFDELVNDRGFHPPRP